jgi:dephospho-CoA kinase
LTFCVGLTGGIGCGKSKAADTFAALGAAVIDTDVISHDLTSPRGAAMDAIATEFGDEFVREDRSLDRAAMRELVFGDPAAKRRLESILHPLIGTEVRTRLSRVAAPYVMVVVPLLLETGSYRDIIDRVLVVDCPEDQQIERTMTRSKLTAEGVRTIIAAQIPRAERLARADDVLANDADIATLEERVRALHERYLRMAQDAARAG